MAPESGWRCPELSDVTFDALAAIADEVAGLHLTRSKKAMVASRISRRLSRLALPSFEDYLCLVEVPHAPERRRMVTALTTNVSSFFREEHHFETLRDETLPALLERARAGDRVRLWSAGCANGQEAYSIALTLLDLEPRAGELDIRILGTDIDPVVVRAADLGAYHTSMVKDVPQSHLRDHFVFDASSSTYKAKPKLRSLVLFRELNLHEQWPMPGRFDVIFCRNVVIYFGEETSHTLWSRFAGKLNDAGWLFVGHSEKIPLTTCRGLQLQHHTVYRKTA